MRKLFFPLLSLCLLTTACKDSVPSPTIEMEGLYINDGEMDYARQMEALPPLKVDDELEISLKLDGNGEAVSHLLRLARKGKVTLLYSARNTEHNEAAALRDYLLQRFAS